MNKYTNPNVKTDWTDDELEMLGDQLNVYFFHIQKLEGVETPGLQLSRKIACSICAAVAYKCPKCPILGGKQWHSCMKEDTYIDIQKRHKMTLQQAKTRLNRLIAYYEANGLEVYDE